jgi:hypothetical protein
VWSADRSDGTPLKEVLLNLHAFLEQYDGDKNDLMIGYWEYGDQIVVTASE